MTAAVSAARRSRWNWKSASASSARACGRAARLPGARLLEDVGRKLATQQVPGYRCAG